ncbi:hypothetical protein ACL2XP_06930 [Sodalis sp. RH21]|uniref:hypothetical protein n=1 Tax=unclassified Sodalis (in: enterobacteria) TaxID=2636512 RepID=UPI0039B4A36B
MGARIFKDGILGVDAGLKPAQGNIVVAKVDGRRVVRRLQLCPAVGLERFATGYVQLVDIVGMNERGVSIFGAVM